MCEDIEEIENEDEEKEVFVCSDCGEEFDSEDDLYKCYSCDELVCKDCAKHCGHCRHHFCDNCIAECERCSHYVCCDCGLSCDSCGDNHCPDCVSTCDGCGNTVCTNCLEACCGCGNYFCRDCLRYCDDCGNYSCEDCYCECEKEVDLDYYHDDPSILNYTAKADWRFVKQPWENTTFLGLELEISFPSNLVSKFFNITKEKLNGLSFWKSDCSINEGEESIGPGGELIVTPHTYLSHRKLNWKSILEEFKKAGGISYDAGSCGLHIHTNKDNLTYKDMNKLRAFFVKNRNFILKFSKRTESSMQSYAFIPKESDLKTWNENPYNADRHICLNLTDDTLEFRIFRGTLDPFRFRACLQFVDSIIQFVKTHGYAACIGPKAVEYFKEHNKGRYSLLNKYIASIGY